MTRRRACEQERLFWDLVFGATITAVFGSLGFLGGSAFIGAIRLVGWWFEW